MCDGLTTGRWMWSYLHIPRTAPHRTNLETAGQEKDGRETLPTCSTSTNMPRKRQPLARHRCRLMLAWPPALPLFYRKYSISPPTDRAERNPHKNPRLICRGMQTHPTLSTPLAPPPLCYDPIQQVAAAVQAEDTIMAPSTRKQALMIPISDQTGTARLLAAYTHS